MKPFAVSFRAALLTVLLLLSTGTAASAQPRDEHQPHFAEDDGLGVPDIDEGGGDHQGGPGMQGKQGHMGGMLAQKLGLTPEQREQIKALRGDRDEQEKNMLKQRLARIELKQMIEKGEAGDDEILKRAEELSKSTVEQNLQRLKKLLAIRKILTPEQRVKFKEFIAERREARQQGNPQGERAGAGFGDRREMFRNRMGFGQQP